MAEREVSYDEAFHAFFPSELRFVMCSVIKAKRLGTPFYESSIADEMGVERHRIQPDFRLVRAVGMIERLPNELAPMHDGVGVKPQWHVRVPHPNWAIIGAVERAFPD